MNIKKMLKNGAKNVLPDEKVKQNIKYRMGIDDTDEEVELGNVKAKLSRHKKAIAIIACALAAVIIVCAFITLMLKKEGSPSSPNPSDPGGIFGQLSSSEQIYGISAASAGMMISGMSSGGYTTADAAQPSSRQAASLCLPLNLSGAKNGANAAPLKTRPGQQIDDEETINTINEYMAMVESFISDDSFTVTGGENTQAEYSGYDFVMSVSYTGLPGDTRDGGTIYYNRTLTKSENDDDETENTYAIDGIMVLDGKAYPIKGEHETENQSDESEDEYEMTISLGDGTHIRVNQELSVETEGGKPSEKEIEYSYILYRGDADDRIDDDFDFDRFDDYDGEGEIISVTTFKYEQEEDETELVMQIWENGKSEIFAFWQEDGIINVSVGGASSIATYTVRIINGEYVYFRGDTEIDRDRD